MAGRSAHVRRISNEPRSPGERRRSSSQGDATPRIPAPAASLGLGPSPAPTPSSGLGLLHPHSQDIGTGTPRRTSSSQPHTPAASTFFQPGQSNNTQTNAPGGQPATRDGQAGAQLTGPAGEHAQATQAPGQQQQQQQQPSRLLGFLGLGDMLQLSSAGLLTTSAAAHNHSVPTLNANSGSHPHLAAAAHSVLAATSFLSAAVPHHRSATTPIPSSLLPARTHSRGESAIPLDRSQSPAPFMAAPPAPPSKGHTSPSKVCPLSPLLRHVPHLLPVSGTTALGLGFPMSRREAARQIEDGRRVQWIIWLECRLRTSFPCLLARP
ncbi:hypothetical protein BD309DRAFT_520753 [Dichomitus squalens]|uniref:Uncharacterized protein n=1 Tax=Dichomitus squalens TaxID=114155 RepID=A0A4Q9NH24_9APHY|nr:hypothetical protein BD309DRAFT_520753 [Dichomitus squalens]TBU55029.1 hypothetical protein BD310DRAFT_715988 [Dichomitus squalens]